MEDTIDRQPIEIVPFEAAHLETLAELERQCFSSPWSYEGLLEELSNPMAVFRVALVDGKVVGYIGMHHVVDEGYITNIAVFEEFRRKGIGRLLLQELKDYGKENDMAFITLEVRCSNLAAIELYRAEDFEVAGMRKGFYTGPTEDALIMTYTY
ncbi:ribosomal protein S18-alanine N-acetyltransferase [Acetanaerobacterium elongatum]|uniref:[Ribosomal protein bS18]-alanine N-acetyltransferase n=1 Tax=Acetanaerobacterium elongatum TaxID=258515 RepID=A0A1G9V6R8_9FIRM|nr:ribosomal protein S18-alanine N-acetyltransferase [Acetanaerobacterium elongatum]SDM67888.1 ribosomal-protein-alanine N-acetyltransferase [Acetanaerobacterium elongatum]